MSTGGFGHAAWSPCIHHAKLENVFHCCFRGAMRTKAKQLPFLLALLVAVADVVLGASDAEETAKLDEVREGF